MKALSVVFPRLDTGYVFIQRTKHRKQALALVAKGSADINQSTFSTLKLTDFLGTGEIVLVKILSKNLLVPLNDLPKPNRYLGYKNGQKPK